MPKVLIISSMGEPPYVGGIENVIQTTVTSRLAEKYSLKIFDTYRKADPDRRVYQKIFFAIRLFFLCGRCIRLEKPHIVHIHFCSRIDFWKHSICLLAAKLSKCKTVFHLHGGSFDDVYKNYPPVIQYCLRLVFKLPDTVVALSTFWVDFLSGLTDPQKIIILPNPINCKELSMYSKDYCDADFRSILLLGSLGMRKGHYDVLHALPIVLERYPDTQVYFGGLDEDFGATKKLKKIATDTNIIDNINFIGTITADPKLKLLGKSSTVILPSYAENMPISVLEGMAAKKPVIATRVGAIPEVFDNGECGLLIEPGDWKALADKIVYLFDNPDHAKKIGQLAYNKAYSNWDVSKIITRIDSIYQNLMENNGIDSRYRKV